MKHPELLRLASEKANVSVRRLIRDAFQYSEIEIRDSTLTSIVHRFFAHDEIPEFVEDYALNVLANKIVYQPQQLLGR